MNTKRSGPAVTPQHRAYTDDMSSQPMWLFRALNERFMNQLAQSETDGSAHADARRTYEKLVALLNSNGTQSLAEGRQCADARVLMEQYFIDRLREAGYNGMRMKNNAICQDTTRRAQMARWRAAHPGYMAAAAREHKQRRAQKLHAQREQETQSHLESTLDGTV